MNLSPIFVSVYDRFEHFTSCIESLAQCSLASDSVLFISSDAANNPEKEEAVSKIRNYIDGLNGFKDIQLISSKSNSGGKIISEVKDLIWTKYNRMVRLEDDNLLHPSFLEFLNESLDRFEFDQRVFSICGYMPPINYENRSECVYRLPWHEPWGYGIWKDRWLNFDPGKTSFDLINSGSASKVIKSYGQFLYDAVWLDLYGFSRAEDARVCMHMLRNGLCSIYSSHSLVINNGHDGSGMNAGRSKRFIFQLHQDALNCRNLEDRGISYELIDKYKAFYDRGVFGVLQRKLGFNRLFYIIKFYIKKILY